MSADQYAARGPLWADLKRERENTLPLWLAFLVAAVLELIPENYRIVLMLRELQNFSTSEIATILERKEATVRWRLAEARSMFHDLWVKRRDGACTSESPIAATEPAASKKSEKKRKGER